MYEEEKGTSRRAQGQYNNASVCTGSIGDSIGQSCDPVNAPPLVDILFRLENINGILRDAISYRRDLLDKLQGASNLSVSAEKCTPVSPGLLNTIDERVGWLMNSAQEITSNQQALSRLA